MYIFAMSNYKKWLKNYTVSVKFPNVSGFEILEMLESRSRLALIENQMSPNERKDLESGDATFLNQVHVFYANLTKIVDLKELRRKRNILPSHWWWYLDKLSERKEPLAAGA